MCIRLNNSFKDEDNENGESSGVVLGEAWKRRRGGEADQHLYKLNENSCSFSNRASDR